MKSIIVCGIIAMLLTMSEDRATLRIDLSAGMEVSGKGDALSITLLLVQHGKLGDNLIEGRERKRIREKK